MALLVLLGMLFEMSHFWMEECIQLIGCFILLWFFGTTIKLHHLHLLVGHNHEAHLMNNAEGWRLVAVFKLCLIAGIKLSGSGMFVYVKLATCYCKLTWILIL